jgi:hypothetical protein
MNQIQTLNYLVIAALILSVSVLTLSQDSAAQLYRYWVALVRDQQISPGDTDAIGFVGFKFSDDYDQLIYNVKNDSQSTTPVLDLIKNIRESNREAYRWSDITEKGQSTGTLNLDGIMKEDLTGPLKDVSIKQLHKLMHDGMLYIVVHTKDHPNGELRGDSFVGMDDPFQEDKIKWK